MIADLDSGSLMSHPYPGLDDFKVIILCRYWFFLVLIQLNLRIALLKAPSSYRKSYSLPL